MNSRNKISAVMHYNTQCLCYSTLPFFFFVFFADAEDFDRNFFHSFTTYNSYEHAFILSAKKVCHTCVMHFAMQNKKMNLQKRNKITGGLNFQKLRIVANCITCVVILRCLARKKEGWLFLVVQIAC